MIAFHNGNVDRPFGIVNRGVTHPPPLASDRGCRLLYLVGQLGLGGLERQLCYLLRAIDRARYRPAVAVWNFSRNDIHVREIRDLGVPVYCFPSGVSRVAKLRGFRCLVRQLDPEVIHSYSFFVNFAAYWAALGTKAVAFGSVRSNFTLDKMDAGPWLGRLSARWPRDQIFNSLSGAEIARRSRSVFVPRGLLVVRNGVDLERFQSLPLPANGRVRILGVGSLLSVKRWDRLLAAAHELKRRGYDLGVKIAGRGPMRSSLEQYALDLGVEDRVEFIGQIDEIPRLLADAAFLAHTSDAEGCPNVVMEAMACGRAVVATDAGDVTHLVEDGKTGFVVPCGAHETLVKRLIELITDRDLCRRMGKAGRAKAEREFRLDRMVSETFAAYRAAGFMDV